MSLHFPRSSVSQPTGSSVPLSVSSFTVAQTFPCSASPYGSCLPVILLASEASSRLPLVTSSGALSASLVEASRPVRLTPYSNPLHKTVHTFLIDPSVVFLIQSQNNV